MSFNLRDRKDRLGTNTLLRIADYIFGMINNVEIYRSRDFKYRESIFSEPFLKYTKENVENKVDTVNSYPGVRGACACPVILLRQDLVSYFRGGIREKFWEIIYGRCKKKFKLPWKDNKNIICIHVRLDDVENLEDYDGRPASNYIRRLIEEDCFRDYSRDEMTKFGLDTQRPINPKKLSNLIKDLMGKYPDKKIHIVSFFRDGKVPLFLRKIEKKLGVELHSNMDPEHDLWLLINSEVLVLSKSTFSIIAGFYHLGNTVYYPVWGTITSLGLGTKYDKSGWISYV